MRITLNGALRDVNAVALPDILEELGYGGARVATAVNEDFVPVTARAGTTLSDGDRLEVVAPQQGG
ncbi:MAG: sulfur carrier protein ThiS [Pseudomonadota bacterium]